MTKYNVNNVHQYPAEGAGIGGYNIAQGLFAVANSLSEIADAIRESKEVATIEPYDPFKVSGRIGDQDGQDSFR